jgi:hypothetical protein
MAVVALMAVAAWYFSTLSRVIIPRGEVPQGVNTSKPYLEVSYALRSETSSTGYSTTTFYIPKAYVEYSGIQLRAPGRYMVPINVELPDKTPSKLAPPRPWDGMDYHSPVRKALIAEFNKTHLGRFRITLAFGLGSAEEFMRTNIDNPRPAAQYAKIGSLAGLTRYAKLDCVDTFRDGEHPEYIKGRLEERAAKRAQAEPDDPPIPVKCVIDRRLVTYFTPVGTPEDQAIYVHDCNPVSCDSNISVNGLSIRFGIPIELLPRWREIVKPTQELLRSFLIKPESAPISSPALASSASNIK